MIRLIRLFLTPLTSLRPAAHRVPPPPPASTPTLQPPLAKFFSSKVRKTMRGKFPCPSCYKGFISPSAVIDHMVGAHPKYVKDSESKCMKSACQIPFKNDSKRVEYQKTCVLCPHPNMAACKKGEVAKKYGPKDELLEEEEADDSVADDSVDSAKQDSMVALNVDSPSPPDLPDDDSLGEGGEAGNLLLEELDARELKDELFRTSHIPTEVAILTPVEIQKASRKWADTSAQREEEKSWTFKSWLPNASFEKLPLDKQPDEFPAPVKLCEEWVTWTGFSTDFPSSGMAGEQSIRRDSAGSIQNVVTPIVFATSVHCKNKSVRFDCESDTSDSSSRDSERSASSGSFTLSKPSPYPMPLKLTDAMQTTGTVYMKNMADGRIARIRSQYVYAGLNPVDYPSQWKVLKDENFDSNHLRESIKLNDEATLTSSPISDKAIKDLVVGQDMKNEASLSSWLEPQSANQDGYNELFVSIADDNVGCGRISGDRPISESSTYKDKEDQKIGSHATPFEESLEEALSEDSFESPRRKLVGGTQLVEFNEAEEYDTALLQLQFSALLKL